MVQCKSMGIWDKWEGVLDTYRDVNQLFGDIVKVIARSRGDERALSRLTTARAFYRKTNHRAQSPSEACRLSEFDLGDTNERGQIEMPGVIHSLRFIVVLSAVFIRETLSWCTD